MKEVKLPDEAIRQAQRLLADRNLIDISLQKFLEGCKIGLGLNGNWNLDTKTWTFTKLKKEK